ncbi:hypothetical protein OG474_34805 [Kribbella sp. NBC_01505]|uniref:hypothetical protein n=1 Tax=Kribbella sp. NBC_01505 TaxID=2903580 RepID=UPI0038635973
MATLFFAGALRVVVADSLDPEALFLAAVVRWGADFLGAVAMGSYPLWSETLKRTGRQTVGQLTEPGQSDAQTVDIR